MPAPQHLYDAIKAVRETGSAWITWKGERMRLRPVTDADKGFREGAELPPEGLESTVSPVVGWCPGPYTAFVKARSPGGVEMASIWWHEGRLHIEGRRSRYANDDVVLAIVAERHKRGKDR